MIIGITLTSFGFGSLTGLNQDVYTNNAAETAEHLLTAMQNPSASLKKWNVISVWTLDMDVENTFVKWYCTYGAARVSPEFFPFSGEKTQQRTWWWNAVDRCKNAADTWYKIWLVPIQWALIVYDAGGRFWSYGHVGKVLHYDKARNKLIVRDMARVARWSMSDRREDLSTANVKCYIYNSKTTIPTIDPIIVPIENVVPSVNTWTWTIPTTITPAIPVIPTVVTPPLVHTAPTVIVPIPPTIPVVEPPIQEIPVIIPTPPTTLPTVPTVPVVVPQNIINNTLPLTLEKLSDIAQHFTTQNDFVFTLISKKPLMLGEVAKLTLEIKNKKTGALYNWLLPFSFTILSTNDNVQTNVSNIQMINNWSLDITILGQKTGTASIVISMDNTKIGEFSLEIQ